MKRLILLILTCILSISLAACAGSRKNESISDTESESKTESKTTQSAENVQDNNSNGADNTQGDTNATENNILIVYFAEAENSEVDAVASPSVVTINGEVKGRMRALAEMIQSETGGELFSIQTSVDYPADIGELIDYAAEEQDDDVRPELTSHIENLENYDTIFVGYPNWWYDMPMVMYSFFDEYDLSGKTIIPFNSHNGSRFSSTIKTIQKLEPAATVITDGFTVNERNVADSAEDVADWLRGLGY